MRVGVAGHSVEEELQEVEEVHCQQSYCSLPYKVLNFGVSSARLLVGVSIVLLVGVEPPGLP